MKRKKRNKISIMKSPRVAGAFFVSKALDEMRNWLSQFNSFSRF